MTFTLCAIHASHAPFKLLTMQTIYTTCHTMSAAFRAMPCLPLTPSMVCLQPLAPYFPLFNQACYLRAHATANQSLALHSPLYLPHTHMHSMHCYCFSQFSLCHMRLLPPAVATVVNLSLCHTWLLLTTRRLCCMKCLTLLCVWQSLLNTYMAKSVTIELLENRSYDVK